MLEKIDLLLFFFVRLKLLVPDVGQHRHDWVNYKNDCKVKVSLGEEA